MANERRRWRQLETLGTVLVAFGIVAGIAAYVMHNGDFASSMDWVGDLAVWSCAGLMVGGIGLNVFAKTSGYWNE